MHRLTTTNNTFFFSRCVLKLREISAGNDSKNSIIGLNPDEHPFTKCACYSQEK